MDAKQLSPDGFISCRKGVLTLLVLLLPLTVCGAAEVYKWLDENGNVHYGDQPAGKDAIPVHIDTLPVADRDLNARLDRQQRMLDELDEQREQQKRDKSDQQAALQKRVSNCLAARQYLEEVVNSGYLYVNSGDPYNPKILNDEERDRATARARDDVAMWCGQ
jgi:hypothetical protein